MGPVLTRDRVVLLWRGVFSGARVETRSRHLLTTCFFPEHVDVLAVVVLHSFVFCNLALKPDLICTLVELLDPSMLKFALFSG